MKKLLLQLINGVLLAAVVLVALEMFWRGSSIEQRQQYLQQWPLRLNPEVSALLPQVLWPAEFSAPTSPTGEPVMTMHERVVDVQRRVRSLTHGGDVCVKPPTRAMDEVETGAVYRWTDANGKVHFGDKPQQQAEDLTKRYGQQTAGVRVTFDYRGWQGEPTLTHELRKQAELLHRVLTRYLEPDYWRQIDLNLTVFASQEAFDQHRDQQGHHGEWAAYYDGRENRAFLARQNGPDGMENTLRIARHEMTHAMMTGMLGSTPTWLAEGMAQYLERLQWQLSSAQVAPPLQAIGQLKQTGAPRFDALLDVRHDVFNGSEQQGNYQQSAAMLHFLLSHDAGRQWLKQTLTGFARQPCRPLPAATAFQRYPGGLRAVNQGYQDWLQAGRFNSHYY